MISSAAQFEAQISEVGKLVPSNGAGSQWFGWSISVSGNRPLVGSPHDGVLAYQHVGSAYVFDRDAGGAWTEVAKLQASDGALGDGFGISVSLCDDRALVGAEDDDDLGLESGSAYVFERDAQGTWTQVAKLLASDGSFDDSFGYTVSIAGDYALVGSWVMTTWAPIPAPRTCSSAVREAPGSRWPNSWRATEPQSTCSAGRCQSPGTARLWER